MFGLEDSRAGWDQFAVNKEKFGVATTWDEHLYTTRIDRAACGISEEEAARLAREIESGVSVTTNIHMLEERGGELDANVSEAPAACTAWRSCGRPTAMSAGCVWGGVQQQFAIVFRWRHA